MRRLLLIVLVVLAGCGVATPPAAQDPTAAPGVVVIRPTAVPPAALEAPTAAPFATAPGAVVIRPPGATPPPVEASAVMMATAEPQASLPPGWGSVTWEGLEVPLPPGASWQPGLPGEPVVGGAPVLASGWLTYPPSGSAVEAPVGPRLVLLASADDPAAWLERYEREEPVGVDRATLAEVTVGGAPALRYQPVVTGTCNAARYLVPLGGGRLLWIWVDCLGQQADDGVVSHLRLP